MIKSGLFEFLLECVAEDERRAKATWPRSRWTVECQHVQTVDDGLRAGWDGPVRIANLYLTTGSAESEVNNAIHIAHWDPPRVLAWCNMAQYILHQHALCQESPCMSPNWPCPSVRAFARFYADRPGFQEEWLS